MSVPRPRIRNLAYLGPAPKVALMRREIRNGEAGNPLGQQTDARND